MGKDEVRKQKIVDQPSMTSVVTSEYFFVPGSDVAIHIKTFKIIVSLTFIGTSILWAIGVWTNWYWQLAVMIGQGFIVHYWLAPAIVTVTALVVWMNRKSLKGGNKKRKPQTEQSENSQP